MSLLNIHDTICQILKSNDINIYNYYLFQSNEIIQKYKKILFTPEKRFFQKKNDQKKIDMENFIKKENKNKIITDFIKLLDTSEIKQYLLNHSNYISQLRTEISFVNDEICKNCNSISTLYEDDNNYFVCSNCYSILQKGIFNNSVDDINRINISQKYIYDRKSHFRECIKQYQGKQNVTIPDQILIDLENILEKNHLLIGTKETDKITRFKKITKAHVLAYLKILGLSFHNENLHLIHSLLTGQPTVDISHLEIKIMNDFDKLSLKYDEMNINKGKSNFINCQYILYQLLHNNGFKCDSKDFHFLNSPLKKRMNDEICRPLFQELGININ